MTNDFEARRITELERKVRTLTELADNRLADYVKMRSERGRLLAGQSVGQEPVALQERVAQLIAHRACCGVEHDPANGKLHGYCVVCGVPWPCQYAGAAPVAKPAEPAACRHEPFEGFCIHCGVQFVDGRAVAQDYVSVLREPTDEMLRAGWNAYLDDMKGGLERFAITYRAMLAASKEKS